MTRAATCVAVVLCCFLQAGRSAVGQIPISRPRLRAGSDTNDAAAYVQHARQLLYIPTDSAHAAAEAALLWASRLDPGSSDVPYLLTVAVFRPIVVQARREGRLSRKLLQRELTPARRRYVDSLMREAWLREPFFDIDLEPLLCFDLVSPRLVRDPAIRGYFAYQFKESRLAVDSWAQALARDSSRVDLRFHRAHTFYWMEQYDSTIGELRAALASVAQPDAEYAPVFSPTYVFNYALGIALERVGQADSAKAAYRRALVENLGLFMARVRLSNLLLLEGDTLQALAEIALAMDVAPREPWLTTFYGYQLLEARRPADAAVQLRNAIALDSAYATPYYLLGVAEQNLGSDSTALMSFEIFLRRAPKSDVRRDWSAQRVAVLRAGSGRSAGPRD